MFAFPGRTYPAWVRFSNAATNVAPDSTVEAGGKVSHGSRGMAVKLLGVEGPMLAPVDGEPVHGAPTQDFLLINQPVFAFANVADYLVLSQALIDQQDDPRKAIGQFIATGTNPATTDAASRQRALQTVGIIQRINAAAVDGDRGAYETPPASPVDNSYFGAAPFHCGDQQVMRFRLRPVAPSAAVPHVADPNYLRTALVQRLRDTAAGSVVFEFEVQLRDNASIDPDRDIENASQEWPTDVAPFEPVATLTIPLQEFDFAERHVQCEQLVFNPWHALAAHQPLGGINRLRRAVYAESALRRSLPKEPGAVP